MEQFKFLHQKKHLKEKHINKRLIQKSIQLVTQNYKGYTKQVINLNDDPEKVKIKEEGNFKELVKRIKNQYEDMKHRKYNVHYFNSDFHRKNRQQDKPRDLDNLII